MNLGPKTNFRVRYGEEKVPSCFRLGFSGSTLGGGTSPVPFRSVIREWPWINSGGRERDETGLGGVSHEAAVQVLQQPQLILESCGGGGLWRGSGV